MSMRRLLFAAIAFVCMSATWACSDPYQQNDFEIFVAARAMLFCNCLYAMDMDEQFCADSSERSLLPGTTYTIDVEHRVIDTQLGVMWSDRARFTSERFGCVFE
jgi:hypothetical protein